MRIPLYSICAVLALTTGCVTDDALYLPGELPGYGGLGGGGGADMDCRVAPEAPATADATAAPLAPSSTVASRRAAGPRGDRAATVGFNTACESWMTE
jgi:hypothetical protein